ncbi:hypothetical protein BgiMline_002914 [Biomphalaria glabrata]
MLVMWPRSILSAGTLSMEYVCRRKCDTDVQFVLWSVLIGVKQPRDVTAQNKTANNLTRSHGFIFNRDY